MPHGRVHPFPDRQLSSTGAKTYGRWMASFQAGWELSEVLEAVEAASPVDAVEAVTGKLAATLGVDRVAFLIADLGGRALVRLGHGEPVGLGARRLGGESADTLPLSDSVVGQVLSRQKPLAVPVSGGWRLLAPVSQRGEVVGLLEALLDSEPDDDTVRLAQRAAHLLAFVVIANRRHTDLFEWGQRSTPFQLSAEIQRRLLPGAFTCEGGEFTLSAWLEPAATIGGDTFDYSLERDLLHLSVTDAMGHGVSSALTATLCVGSLRNSRRAGASILEQAAAADAAMRAHGGGSFVTGLLGRVDLRSGVVGFVNAGHEPPLLIRGAAITPVQLPADLPFGLNADREYRRTDLRLEPGDRVVIVTDGMLERRAAALPLAALLEQTRTLHPREATRHLADTVLDVAGPQLADDATVLMLDWHGPHHRQRDSRAGADHT
jgi:serine phosphatase RsbU (regulator of sigma subunit)